MFNENTWKNGEKLVQNYMKKHGYKLIYTNFPCVGVELDIVAILPAKANKKNLKQELTKKLKTANSRESRKNLKQIYKNSVQNLKDMLVITEVKARLTEKFGKGFEAIDAKKKQHIKRGAEFLLKDEKLSNLQVRFDVASVDGNKITYIENAF